MRGMTAPRGCTRNARELAEYVPPGFREFCVLVCDPGLHAERAELAECFLRVPRVLRAVCDPGFARGIPLSSRNTFSARSASSACELSCRLLRRLLVRLLPRLLRQDLDDAELSRGEPTVQVRQLLAGQRREFAHDIVQLAAQRIGSRELFLGRLPVVLIH